MATYKIPDSIEFAGDYDLKNIFLHNHVGEVIDIKNLVQELNIYESIYKNALTGSLVIVDAQNLIAKLEIQGTERISFTLSTPGAIGDRSVINASEATGHPFHVYKITDRKQIAPGTLLYTLHFGSREFMRNMRTKVSQAYEGRLDRAVHQIMFDDNYLDSKKELTFEPCGNNDKVVIPNLRPFDAINMIASKSLPEKSSGVGYYFYETTKGFHFRSWDNMISVNGRHTRDTKQEFYYMPMNITDPTIEDKINHDYKSVESYRFINNFHDVAANTLGGTYGHRVITHNLFDKSYNIEDYHYHDDFVFSKHSESAGRGDLEKYAIAESNVDERPHNTVKNTSSVSDYAESRVSLQSTTQFLHNEETGAGYGLDVLQDGKQLGKRVAQQSQVIQGTALKLTVKGQSYLECGDLIEFKLRSVDEKNTDGAQDPQYAGKYVITKIRHQINPEKYTMVLECAKDSVKSGFSTSDFKIPRNRNISTLRNTYEEEEGIVDY
jgi:hypothetical protein